MLVYPSTIDLSSAVLRHLCGLLRHRRRVIGSTYRRLPAVRQALLVLAYLRNGDTYAQLAAGFGIGLATAWRYVQEAVAVLAAAAPSLTAAIWRLIAPRGPRRPGHGFAVLDGTLVRIDRVAGPAGPRNRLFYDGKHRHHGVNLQALTDPDGNLIWISAGVPGSTTDLTAARIHRIFLTAAAAGLALLADLGYLTARRYLPPELRLFTPYKRHKTRRKLTAGQRAANRAHAGIRGQGERGFATLKNWRILRRYRGCPTRVGTVARAALTLELGPEH